MPCATPRISLQPDKLPRRPSITNPINSRLVQVRHQPVVHVVVLVVGVEDDELVVLEAGGDGGPPGFEAGDIGDDLVVVAAWGEGVSLGLGGVWGFGVPKLWGSTTA